jgi:hypothetical protein
MSTGPLLRVFVNGQSLQNPFWSAFRTSSIVLVLIVALSIAFVSPLIVLVPLAGAAFFWLLFRHPVVVLGMVLAFMPVDYMAIELGKFAGLPHMSVVSACTKEIPLLLLSLILWRRNGFTFATPDRFLLACFAIAAVYTVIDGSLSALALDFNFMVPYFVGRVTVLTEEQQQRWAGRAVWLVGVLAVLGLIEVWVLGEGPRTMLYLGTDAETDPTTGQLSGAFHATGLSVMREAATMIGPAYFGALCMIALILWWVYCRNHLPAGMIAIGLISSVTRSAWVGTAAAIPFLAFLMNQTKRFFWYAALALVLFAAAIPIFGLSDYLLSTKSGEDTSAEGHQEEIVDGAKYVVEHPFGSGNRRLSVMDRAGNNNAVSFETTYINVAAEYGIPASLCLIGYLSSALFLVLRKPSRLGYAAAGILVGLGLVMVVTLPLHDRRMGSWAFFPIGMAVRSSTRKEDSDANAADAQPEPAPSCT